MGTGTLIFECSGCGYRSDPQPIPGGVTVQVSDCLPDEWSLASAPGGGAVAFCGGCR
ncbi:hypothetical protein [Mycolicibacterium fortuitum]|uniref:hypothetical protein n=1 Tax=Mycolicibacterium fortuitum TaxID=1766 RepID=UPI002612602A|nr:hypothetical protein [Mycolicibacterium fortuitum]